MRSRESLIAWLDAFPPFVCRIVARKANGQQRMTLREIAAVSGLSKSTVASISKRTTWAGMPVNQIDHFCFGCGVNIFQLRRQIEFLRKKKWSFLTRPRKQRGFSTGHCAKYYDRLCSLKG